ncbi:MAG: hypothetical protein JXB49_17705 [Bacteroidales bacterium]|nr:hypothetical protein [Bacteroidales bacterium]
MENVICQSWWYWFIAAVISFYHGVRGFIAQKQTVEQQKNQLLDEKKLIEFKLESNAELNAGKGEKLKSEWMKVKEEKFIIYAKTNCQTVWLRAIPYSFFYFITTFLGFCALFFVYYILTTTSNLNNISGGTTALLIFAVLYGIIGITGQLPTLIEQGKLPK